LTSFDLIWDYFYLKRFAANGLHYLADINQSDENLQNIPARGNGSMINYKLDIFTNTLTGLSTWTFEVNGVPKITILVPGLSTGVFTSVISVPFVKDDLLVFKMSEASPSALVGFKQSAKFQFTN